MDRREMLRILGLASLAACARRSDDGVDSAAATKATDDTTAARAGGAAGGTALANAPIGIQLYTLRTVLEKNPEPTLAALAEIGYKEVELAGLYGLTAAAMRALLDKHGLTAPATHIPLDQLRTNLTRVIDDAKTLGHQYVVCPYLDEKERTADGYKRAAETLNSAGERVKQAGMQMAYHNHDFEFKTLGAGPAYDTLLAQTDPQLVKMELDLYWITEGGKDPLAYFAKYPGRFPLVHVKDRAADGKQVDVGQGAIDYKNVLAHAAAEGGTRHFFVERDEPTDPLATARVSFAGLRKALAG